jgi:hypothetical protein
MKDYDKNAAVRRARMETALVFRRIQDEMFDRIKQYIDTAHAKSITDGSSFNADQVGKDAASFGAEPWSIGAKPAIAHKPDRKARKR